MDLLKFPQKGCSWCLNLITGAGKPLSHHCTSNSWIESFLKNSILGASNIKPTISEPLKFEQRCINAKGLPHLLNNANLRRYLGLCQFLFATVMSKYRYTSLKLTWHLKIGHPKRKVVFQPSIFRCYVSFR